MNPELKAPEIAELVCYLGEGLSADVCGEIDTENGVQLRRLYSFLTEDNTLVSREHSDLIRSYLLTGALSTDEVQLKEGFRPEDPHRRRERSIF